MIRSLVLRYERDCHRDPKKTVLLLSLPLPEIRRGQHTSLGPHPAREGQDFDFISGCFLAGIWRNMARGRK
jgi:hypothetical protein